MLAMINQGEVGLVVARDYSRVSRDPMDAAKFFWSAKQAGTLIYENGALHDPANDSAAELFGIQLGGLLGWFENANRVRHFSEARIAKARRGHAVSAPPIGYVSSGKGQWIKDPDPEIQAAVQRVFTLYCQLGSLGKVIKYMRANDLHFPRRIRGASKWRGLDPAHLHDILCNPAYVGDYVFRRHPARPTSSSLAPAARREPIVTKDHHEAYITRAEWQTIGDMLAAARPSFRPIAGKGHALLQGLLRCAQCQQWLRTQYWSRDGQARTATYACRQTNEWGSYIHKLSCPARFLDHAVVEKVLQALRPFELQEVLAVVETTRTEHTTLERTRRRQLERAEDEVNRAHQAYLRAGKQHPRVMVALEVKYEEALASLEQVKGTMNAASPRVVEMLGPADTDELLELSSRFRDLWEATTTTNEDRKRLLRLMLTEIVVREADKTKAELELVWAGGRREVVRVLRPQGVDAYVREQTLAGKRATTITKELQAAGVITSTGRPMTLNAVSSKLGRLGLRRRTEWLSALKLIRQGLLEKKQHGEILLLLKERAPRLGPWDAQRLSNVIRRLRKGIAGIDPLPEVLPGELEERQVLEIIDARRRRGDSWIDIAEEVNAAGLRPQRARRFTPNQLRTLHLRARSRETDPKTTRA
jgi:DNA invertase Pin-like site-specific DNA recombinase